MAGWYRSDPGAARDFSAPAAKAGRPTANSSRKLHPQPQGKGHYSLLAFRLQLQLTAKIGMPFRKLAPERSRGRRAAMVPRSKPSASRRFFQVRASHGFPASAAALASCASDKISSRGTSMSRTSLISPGEMPGLGSGATFGGSQGRGPCGIAAGKRAARSTPASISFCLKVSIVQSLPASQSATHCSFSFCSSSVETPASASRCIQG